MICEPRPEERAHALRESARQIRRHVEECVCSVAFAKRWLAVADCKERQAEALERECA